MKGVSDLKASESTGLRVDEVPVQIIEDSIIKLLKKHPYFKKPSDHPIRLITIMKYLKKKGVDTSIHNIDLLVEELILGIDGVKKIQSNKYIFKG